MTTLVLVHSPLVGPLTWTAVAEELGARGETAIVPTLLPALHARPPYWQRIVEHVVEAVDGDRDADDPLLVAHSAAGAYLPAIRAGLRRRVAGYLFVDARLPAPDVSLFDSGPPEMAERLRAVASDGWLPRWSEWFGDEVMQQALPDERLRERFVSELPRLPLALFEEPLPGFEGWPDAPCAYFRLSAAYRDEAEQARAMGWPLLERDGGHIDTLTHPREITDGLLALASRAGIAR